MAGAELNGGRTDFEFFDFWYQNERKIDGLFSELNGRLERERKETTSRGAGGTGRVGIELGGILAALGLVKATAGAEVRTDYEKILEITSSLSTENRIGLLLTFLRRQGELSEVVLSGYETRADEAVAQALTGSRFQLMLGEFLFVRADDDHSELHSARLSSVTGKPLIRVPLLNENMQAYQSSQVFWTDPDSGEEPEIWPHEVFCRCTQRPTWILANPIAIWLPDAAHSPTATWSTGMSIAAGGANSP